MSGPVVVPIVEGHSEVGSVPLLLRRVLAERGSYHISIARPVRVPRFKIVKPGELERAITLARKNRERCDAVLVLLDAEDDCPKELAPELLDRATQANSDLPIRVVLAKTEFEAWFLGSLESLRGFRGIPSTAQSPEEPEEIRGAKEYLTRTMLGRCTYVEVADQPAFAERFHLKDTQRRCPSFDKLVRDIAALAARLEREVLLS